MILRLISTTLFFMSFGLYAQSDSLELNVFGEDFLWGVACASYQVEGAWDADGKGPSVWDDFTHQKGKIKDGSNGDVAVDFYNNYKDDIALSKSMNLDVFRFSLSWSRIFPSGVDSVNQKGIEFYHNVIDECHAQGIEPWVTLYHWDLPLALEEQGGWTDRMILDAFIDYVTFCAKEYGSKVKNWMIMNEPAAFVGLGYMMGYHAPGKKGVTKFLKATHHACLAMAEGGRIIRAEVENANVGSTFSCSSIEPYKGKTKNNKAVAKFDAMLNRLYIEPALGLGYPYDAFPVFKRIEKYFEKGDEERLKFDFDFIGIQNYFRMVVKRSWFPPLIWAKEVPALKRYVPVNEMNFEIYPEGIYKMLKKFGAYGGVKRIIVTENGVCVTDSLENGQVHDEERIQFFKDYLGQVLKAKNEGIPVDGYFVWSLTDNFEWSEGYEPRFGLIYVDYPTQKRYMKDSGKWFKSQLEN